ncbi:hypothetical protein [Alterinioella nitratireducens]|uniref:hypothetical protein n=1 Tax=Alterinioella nitratireducens TaxID=2735915 RepID=UPI00155336AF|nr:hypothetical protein [Alterinioella nitratireducens]NPD21709.1 hypothetical protein [Alterinioella nitratireducens]
MRAETFIAALALALRLADEVESLSGKIRMDTILIDEGFGRLDTENDASTLAKVNRGEQSLSVAVGSEQQLVLDPPHYVTPLPGHLTDQPACLHPS